MNRAHRTPDDRLAGLSTEDRDLFERCSPQELLDHAADLLGQVEDLQRQLEKLQRRRSAVELYADRAMRAEGLESLTVRRRADGAEVVWTPHADGTGFHRVRLNRPIRREVP